MQTRNVFLIRINSVTLTNLRRNNVLGFHANLKTKWRDQPAGRGNQKQSKWAVADPVSRFDIREHGRQCEDDQYFLPEITDIFVEYMKSLFHDFAPLRANATKIARNAIG